MNKPRDVDIKVLHLKIKFSQTVAAIVTSLDITSLAVVTSSISTHACFYKSRVDSCVVFNLYLTSLFSLLAGLNEEKFSRGY